MVLPPIKGKMLLRKDRHFPIQSQCDICGYDMETGERALGLIGHGDVRPVKLDPVVRFRFPAYAHVMALFPAHQVCRDTKCPSRHLRLTETATAHVSCYNFMAKCCRDAGSSHLSGAAIAWRQPWHAGSAFSLRPRTSTRKGMSLAAKVYDMPMLADLPLEILEMIRSHCEKHVIWRFGSVAELVDSLDGAESLAPVSLPLRKISAWERGSSPIMSRDALEPIMRPIIRLTVDYRGLQRIERLAELPTSDSSPSKISAYAFEVDSKEVDDSTKVHFQNGLGRLERPENQSNLPVWDIPWAPLSLIGKQFPESFRLTTINLQKCTGMTFFLWNDGVYGIHAHTAASPDARPTARAMARRMERDDFQSLLWVYVPFAPPDRVTAFGIRARYRPQHDRPLNGCCFLIQFALGGDVSIGPYFSSEVLDYTRTVNSRSVLVHNVPEFNEPISFLTLESDGEAGVKISRPPVTAGEPLLSSSASLANTAALRVFEDHALGFCRGIIVEYTNGAQRALGECRLGEHRIRVYKKPTHICMTRRITRAISCKDVRVKAVADPSTGTSEARR